jgi:histidinol-phosphate aminotransferase
MAMTPVPAARPEVTALQPDAHGGPDYRELKGLRRTPIDVLDFSSSTNPFGPPPGVLEALAGCDVTRYPDRQAEPLRSCLAEREGIETGRLAVANGTAQLIWSIAMAYLRPGDAALIVGPTFGEYRVASALMGAQIREVRADAGRGFRPDLAGLCRALEETRPRVVWLCNPNNPTGAYLTVQAVEQLLSSSPGTLWAIDEAYRPFMAGAWDARSLLSTGSVVLLRSLTKDYAVPGLRLGYAMASEPIIGALERVLPPWSVSAAAIAAGTAALHGRDHVRRTIEALQDEAARLYLAIAGQGWRILPSPTHFFLVEVGDAAGFRARLLRGFGIQVRDCASFGLPEFIRIAAQTPEANDRLCRAMEELR